MRQTDQVNHAVTSAGVRCFRSAVPALLSSEPQQWAVFGPSLGIGAFASALFVFSVASPAFAVDTDPRRHTAAEGWKRSP